jgi:hypothetical protein
MVQNKVHQNKLSETPSAQKKNIKFQVQNTINALSITTPLGVNALESGEIPEN